MIRYLLILTSWVCVLDETSRCANPDTTSHSISILDSAGKLFGTLKSSHDGDTLFLVLPGGRQVPIGLYADSLIQSARAPTGDLRADVYVRNCGATVDFATRVILQSPSAYDVVAVFEGRQNVKVEWMPESTLVIHQSPLTAEHVFQQKSELDGYRVSYLPDLPAATPTKYLDFSCYNYGATGRAAGQPTELLFRLAGWSQYTSGLWRETWGHWWGSSPYGDDTNGNLYIQSGIKYYEDKHGHKH